MKAIMVLIFLIALLLGWDVVEAIMYQIRVTRMLG